MKNKYKINLLKKNLINWKKKLFNQNKFPPQKRHQNENYFNKILKKNFKRLSNFIKKKSRT